MRRLIALSVVAAAALSASQAQAALVLSQNDGATPAVYANGGGTGFGGPLGGGSVSFDAAGGNLNIGVSASNATLGNNLIVVQLDTKSGGVLDNAMNDTADGGRRASSSPALNGDVTFPVTPDYALAIGGFGAVLFELVPGTNLNFVQFTGASNSMSIPLSSIGNPTTINFFSYLTSETGFLSNETLPATGYNSGGNPGFGTGTFAIADHNQFVIPEPATLGALAGAGLLALRRRK